MIMDINRNNEPKSWLIKSDSRLEQKLRRIKDVTINANDVICGRGKTSFNHVGNRQFRDTVTASIAEYNNAHTRLEKKVVVNAIVQQVRATGGRFIKLDHSSGKWLELNDQKVKMKVAQAIRDAIAMSLLRSRGQEKAGKSTTTKESATFCTGSKHGSLEGEVDCFPELAETHYRIMFGNGRSSSIGSNCFDTDEENQDSHVPTHYNNNHNNGDNYDEFLLKINDVLGPISSGDRDPIQALLNFKRT